MSSFFSLLNEVEVPPAQAGESHNQNVEPLPEMVTGAFRMLVNFLETMQTDEHGSKCQPAKLYVFNSMKLTDFFFIIIVNVDESGEPVLESMIRRLREQADDPPNRVDSVPDSFFDELERVDKKTLKEDWVCPICSNPFLEG
jgi:hypothetical protein